MGPQSRNLVPVPETTVELPDGPFDVPVARSGLTIPRIRVVPAAGAEVARAAAARARRKTGALAASFGPLVTGGGVTISSPLVYFGVQEFGWSAHGITPSLALTSALDESAPPVESIYFDAVDTAVGQVRGK
jgi:hypothetical protein